MAISRFVLCCTISSILTSAAAQEGVNATAAGDAFTPIWSGDQYPNPKVNFKSCRMSAPAHLCDPDNILTLEQRLAVQKTAETEAQAISRHGVKLSPNVKACEGVRDLFIYTVLARRIQTVTQNTTDEDMLRFTNLLALKWKLEMQPCQNFVILVGVESERFIYIKTGKHLIIPRGQANKVFEEHETHFNDENYQRGLEGMILAFSQMLTATTTTTTSTTTTTTTATTTTTTSTAPFIPLVITKRVEAYDAPKQSGFPWWLIVLLICLLILLLCLICFFLAFAVKRKRRQAVYDTEQHHLSNMKRYEAEKEVENGVGVPIDTFASDTSSPDQRRSTPSSLSGTSLRISIEDAQETRVPTNLPLSLDSQLSEDQTVSCVFTPENSGPMSAPSTQTARPADLPVERLSTPPTNAHNASRPDSYQQVQTSPVNVPSTPTRFAQRMENESRDNAFPKLSPSSSSPTKTADVKRLSNFQQ